MSIRTNMNIDFILKSAASVNTVRQIMNVTGSRRENVAEHTFTMVMMCVTMLDDRVTNDQLLHIIKLCLVHDLGEIDAGDVNFDDHTDEHDTQEELAALNLFSYLDSSLIAEYSNLWYEFKNIETIEAKYAKAIDKLAGSMLVYSHLVNGTAPPMWKQVSASSIRNKIAVYIDEMLPEYSYITEYCITEGIKRGLVCDN